MANLNHSVLEDIKELNITDKECDGTLFGLENCYKNVGLYFLETLKILICILGLVGNGVTIWLLGFLIEKNLFTTYIINLAIADFGVLFALLAHSFSWIPHTYTSFNVFYIFKIISLVFFFLVYNTSLSLLAAISIDRCVSIFFPLWYRCHRPIYLSCVTCAIIWICNIVFSVTNIVLKLTGLFNSQSTFLCFLNIVILTTLISVSTITLVIKVCLMSTKLKQKRIITVVLLSLLAFLLFGLPMNVIYYYMYYVIQVSNTFIINCGFLCASINSTANPFIYYLIGNKKRGKIKKSLKMAFAKVFEEEN